MVLEHWEHLPLIKRGIGTYDTLQAPPATVFLHDLQLHIPTECRFTVFLPQKVHVYRACCEISIFFTCFRREAPYLIQPGQLLCTWGNQPRRRSRLDGKDSCRFSVTYRVPYFPVTPTSVDIVSLRL